MNREQELEIELSNIIAHHADWLDGPTFWELCKTAAYAYFDDLPSADDLVQALRKELGL